MESPKQNGRPDNNIVIHLSTNWKEYFKGFRTGAREGFIEGLGLSVKDTNKTDTQRILESTE